MIREYCGLFGIHGSPDAVRLAVYGLYAQQHRGEEAAGVAWTDGRTLKGHKGLGLVTEALADLPPDAQGRAAIGHTRYSTTGASAIANAQPLLVTTAAGAIACGHNGNLVNAGELRRAHEARGHIFQTTTDSEVIVHLLASPGYRGLSSWPKAFARLRGAYSLVLLTPTAMVAARDPLGMRPLALGRLGRATVVASETTAFDLLGATFERELEPGEVLVVTSRGRRSMRIPGTNGRKAHCLFEHVYFARPDSRVFGDPVHAVRRRLGERLAAEHPADADLVVPVPDSGNFAAEGFAARSGIPLGHGFVRNHYVGRTFIQPQASQRAIKARVKLNPLKDAVKGRRVVVVDDSVVRGTTARERVTLLREAGAREVHLRVSCPPILHPCYFGIDFPTRSELVASGRSIPQIARFLGVDSLGYLSLEGMRGCVSRPAPDYCTACWSGRYPMPVSADHARRAANGGKS